MWLWTNRKAPEIRSRKYRSTTAFFFTPLIKKPSPTHFRVWRKCLEEGESVLCNAIHSVNLNIALNECQTTWKLSLHPIWVQNLVFLSLPERSLAKGREMFYYHYAATFINPVKVADIFPVSTLTQARGRKGKVAGQPILLRRVANQIKLWNLINSTRNISIKTCALLMLSFVMQIAALVKSFEDFFRVVDKGQEKTKEDFAFRSF